jgi:subtilisin family serine protease
MSLVSRPRFMPKLSTVLLLVSAFSATPASAARYAYVMAGQRNELEPARFHAAVQTPTAERATQLSVLLNKVFGAGVQTLTVSTEGLTLVRIPEAQGRPALNDVLHDRGFATRIAFSAHFKDGLEAWPSVIMSEVRVRFRSADVARRALAGLAVGVRWVRNADRDYLLTTKSSEQALAVALDLVVSGKAEFAYPDLLYRHVKHFQPNDTYYGELWHLQNIGAEGAWDLSTGVASVVVAIIDDGTDLSHADLSLNIVGGYDVVGNGYQTDTDPSPTGNDAHGTATAGLAAAVGDNNRGISGVCPHCKIMPIRIMGGNGYNRASTDEDAFNWARTHGANVLSNSWGPAPPIDSNYLSDGLRSEIHNAVAENRVVLFASGNEHTALTCPSGVPWEPAAYNEVISVGATDFYDRRMDYSNYGNVGCPLTLVAPAASFSTDITGARGYNSLSFGNDYTDAFGGTSASTPVTAGAVALLLSIKPTLTWGQVLSVLKSSADKIGGVTYDGTGYHREYGFGRLNLFRAATYVDSGTLCQPEVGGETYGTPACSDGRDNDCDGLKDAADPSCAPSDVNIGATCAQGCGSQGKFCLTEAEGFPNGGYCVSSCTTGNVCPSGAACWACACDTSAQCDPDADNPGHDCPCDPNCCTCNTSAACDADAGGTNACGCDPDCNLCMDVCLRDNECRASYICDNLWSVDVKVCMPGCQSGFFTCAPDTCNSTTGRCEHNGATAPGGSCTVDQDCSANGWCIGSQAQPDASWPGGYCAPECPTTGACPAGAACVHFTDFNLCLGTCTEKPDCRTGYGCWPGIADGAAVCFPVCAESDCQGGKLCCSATGACEAPVNCPTDPCACNTTNQCEAGCNCDTDCCTCNTTTSCDTGCACDPDCCVCDTGSGCQVNCACDPGCGGGCTCDTGVGCQVGCSCDPDCTPATCACDEDVTCDATCACDAECPCECDTTYSCEKSCTCDPDCFKKGCSCAGTDSRDAQVLILVVAAMVAWSRRRKAMTV